MPRTRSARAALDSLLREYPVLKADFALSAQVGFLAVNRCGPRPIVLDQRRSINDAMARSTLAGQLYESTRFRVAAVNGLFPENDAAHGWDWRDAEWYGRWNLPYPFSADQNVGVDLSLDPCRSEDGWELYVRRILTSDGLVNPVDFTPVVRDAQKYFALYNLYTGVLSLPSSAAAGWSTCHFMSLMHFEPHRLPEEIEQ